MELNIWVLQWLYFQEITNPVYDKGLDDNKELIGVLAKMRELTDWLFTHVCNQVTT